MKIQAKGYPRDEREITRMDIVVNVKHNQRDVVCDVTLYIAIAHPIINPIAEPIIGAIGHC